MPNHHQPANMRVRANRAACPQRRTRRPGTAPGGFYANFPRCWPHRGPQTAPATDRPPPQMIDDRRMTWVIATAITLSVSLGLAAHAAGAGSQAYLLALGFLALSAITLLLLKRFLEG